MKKIVSLMISVGLSTTLYAKANETVLVGSCAGIGNAIKMMYGKSSQQKIKEMCKQSALNLNFKTGQLTQDELNGCINVCLLKNNIKKDEPTAAEIVKQSILQKNPNDYPQQSEPGVYLLDMTKGSTAESLLFIYRFDKSVLNLKKDETLSPEAKQAMISNLHNINAQQLCQNGIYYLKKGIIYTYRYSIEDKGLIGEFNVSVDDCK